MVEASWVRPTIDWMQHCGALISNPHVWVAQI